VKKLALLALFALGLSLLSACGSSTSNTGNTGGGNSNVVTMGSVTFHSDSITIKTGDTITFKSDPAGSPHILGIGKDGDFTQPEAGAPDFGSQGHMINVGESWTTPPWNTPGTYHVSCSIHPTTMADFVVTVTG
jgi:plastocyanin